MLGRVKTQAVPADDKQEPWGGSTPGPTTMDRPSRTPAHSADAAVPPARILSALFAAEADRDALERMLLRWAVHPAGGDAVNAWLLTWEPRDQVLSLQRHLEREDRQASLLEELGRARRAAPQRLSRDERAIPWGIEPSALVPALAEVWRGGGAAIDVRGGGEGTPWAEASPLAAIALRQGPRPHGLLLLSSASLTPENLDSMQELTTLALEAHARTAETRRRARQAAAMSEFVRTSVSAVNVAEALHLLARHAAQSVSARGSAVFRSTREGGLELAVTHGPGALREPFAIAFQEAAAEVAHHGQMLSGEHGRECAGLASGVAGETSVWALLPLAAYGHTLGVLVVHDGRDREPAGFERGDLEHLSALADHAALLLEHADRVTRQQSLERAGRDHAARAIDLEARATLGELAARVAEESRNPIASIGAFARRALRECAEEDPRREALEIVLREAGRLETLLAEQSRWSGLDRPRLRMQSLNAVVQEALQKASESLVRRRVRLIKKLAPDLPELLLDAPRIQRVVENVLAHALESAPPGGRIRLETRRAGAFVVVDLAHDGSRQTTGVLDQLFVPFAPGATGAALGLGMAHQVVREHGGEVRVRSEGDWGAVIAFTLPVLENSDRRQKRDRRAVRNDRRRRGPESAAG